jgi:hypothetical protein
MHPPVLAVDATRQGAALRRARLIEFRAASMQIRVARDACGAIESRWRQKTVMNKK